MSAAEIRALDDRLVQIVDAALLEAKRLAGDWLDCRPGCTQCCIGAFAIGAADAVRLREGLARLEANDPARAAQVRERARESVARIAVHFPGDPCTGILHEGETAEARFDEFANEEPCPALDPDTGLCDLYESRPMTCRTFGPPLRLGPDSIAVCELCFAGATGEQIAACEVRIDTGRLEAELEARCGEGRTIVAFALASGSRR